MSNAYSYKEPNWLEMIAGYLKPTSTSVTVLELLRLCVPEERAEFIDHPRYISRVTSTLKLLGWRKSPKIPGTWVLAVAADLTAESPTRSSVALLPSTWQRLRVHAAQSAQSVNQALQAAIELYLEAVE